MATYEQVSECITTHWYTGSMHQQHLTNILILIIVPRLEQSGRIHRQFYTAIWKTF